MDYVLVNPKTGSIELLDEDTFIVPMDTDTDWNELEDDDLVNAADNPQFIVIPLLEQLEFEDDFEDDQLGRLSLHLAELGFDEAARIANSFEA